MRPVCALAAPLPSLCYGQGKATEDVQVSGPLPPMAEALMKLLARGFGLGWHWLALAVTTIRRARQ